MTFSLNPSTPLPCTGIMEAAFAGGHKHSISLVRMAQ